MESIEEKFEKVRQEVAGEAADVAGESEKLDKKQLQQELDRAKELISNLKDDLRLREEQVESYKAAAEQNEKLAETDSRTGLLNKLGFDRRVRPMFGMFARGTGGVENQRQESNIAFNLLFLDIDNFKSFNTTYGHAGGDEAIKGVARVLQAAMRPGDVVCRWGGEEFAIAFMSSQEIANPASQNRGIVAERIRRQIENAEFDYNGQPLKVTVSIGAAKVRAGETYEEFFARANLAMNKAKERGRNRIVVAEVEAEAKS